MFFRVFFLCFFLIFLSSLSFGFERIGISLELSPSWNLLNSTPDTLYLSCSDNSTAKISRVNLSELRSVKMLAKERRSTLFKSFQVLLARPGTLAENKKANSNELFIVVYSNKNPDEKIGEEILAEYIYLYGTKYYIIDLKTPKNEWQKVQPSWKNMIDTFKISTPRFPILDK